MPPKQRKKTESPESKQSDHTAKQPSAQAQPQKKLTLPDGQVIEKKKKTVKWSPVFRRLGYFALIILIPTLLNYAALKQETRALLAKGVHSVLIPD